LSTCACPTADGARPTPSAQRGSISSGTLSQPRHPLPFSLSFLLSFFLGWRKSNLITGNRELNQTPTHTPPGGARPTLLAQCEPICTWTPSHPRRTLLLALIIPTAWREKRPFLHRKNLQEETSLWDNLLRRYLCPVSRLCRPASNWPGHNSPVLRCWEPGPYRCPHLRVDCGWMIVVRTPQK